MKKFELGWEMVLLQSALQGAKATSAVTVCPLCAFLMVPMVPLRLLSIRSLRISVVPFSDSSLGRDTNPHSVWTPDADPQLTLTSQLSPISQLLVSTGATLGGRARICKEM